MKILYKDIHGSWILSIIIYFPTLFALKVIQQILAVVIEPDNSGKNYSNLLFIIFGPKYV